MQPPITNLLVPNPVYFFRHTLSKMVFRVTVSHYSGKHLKQDDLLTQNPSKPLQGYIILCIKSSTSIKLQSEKSLQLITRFPGTPFPLPDNHAFLKSSSGVLIVFYKTNDSSHSRKNKKELWGRWEQFSPILPWNACTGEIEQSKAKSSGMF